MKLTDAQFEQLLKGINPQRVSTFKKAGKEYGYVEAYEIRAHLIRLFGPVAWSEDVTAMELVFEDQNKDGKWTVCYRAAVRLTIGDATYTEWATGDAQNQPSRADAHDLAVKTAQSQAFKRCAMNLGDQFGLSLYRKGSKAPLVVRTLVWSPPEQEEPNTDDVTSHITEALPPESESETPPREVSSPMPAQPASAAPPAADDPMAKVRSLTTFRKDAPPDERMRGVREAMAVAIEHGLAQTPTQAGVTLGAWLTAELQKAHQELAQVAS